MKPSEKRIAFEASIMKDIIATANIVKDPIKERAAKEANIMNDLMKELGGLVKTTFSQVLHENASLYEIGPRMAAKGIFTPKMDARSNKIREDVITSLFREYIGKDLPFYIKTMKVPTKYKLIQVKFYEVGDDKKLILYFYNDTGVDDDAPYADNKKEIDISYDMVNDKFDRQSTSYEYNQNIINFLIKAANLIKQTYYTRFPIMVNKSNNNYSSRNSDYSIDTNATENAKKSRVSKQNFRMFSYDSSNLMDKPSNTNINELSKELIQRTSTAMQDRGMNIRADRLTSSYIQNLFNDLINKPIGDGLVIASFGIRQIEMSGGKSLIIHYRTPSSQEYNRTHGQYIYNIDTDNYNVDFPISRQTARTLSVIATRLNPDTKYKNTSANFQINNY